MMVAVERFAGELRWHSNVLMYNFVLDSTSGKRM
jgi:hypothetical protein